MCAQHAIDNTDTVKKQIYPLSDSEMKSVSRLTERNEFFDVRIRHIFSFTSLLTNYLRVLKVAKQDSSF